LTSIQNIEITEDSHNAMAKWPKAPDWKLRSNFVGSILSQASNFSTLDSKINQ